MLVAAPRVNSILFQRHFINHFFFSFTPLATKCQQVQHVSPGVSQVLFECHIFFLRSLQIFLYFFQIIHDFNEYLIFIQIWVFLSYVL